MWIQKVTTQYAQEQGWRVQDTMLELLTRKEACREKKAQVEIGFANHDSGSSGSAIVAASEHPNEKGRDVWVEEVRQQLAKEKGWTLQSTKVWIVRVHCPDRAPEPAAAPANPVSVEQLSQCLIMTKSDKESGKVCRKILKRYTENLLHHSANPKYRKIPMNNKKFKDCVACVDGGIEWLRQLGFGEVDGELVMNSDLMCVALLSKALEMLQEAEAEEALYD